MTPLLSLSSDISLVAIAFWLRCDNVTDLRSRHHEWRAVRVARSLQLERVSL
jgi:hypothetical protein